MWTVAGVVPAGSVTATSASPPATRSARVERTVMVGLEVAAETRRPPRPKAVSTRAAPIARTAAVWAPFTMGLLSLIARRTAVRAVTLNREERPASGWILAG